MGGMTTFLGLKPICERHRNFWSLRENDSDTVLCVRGYQWHAAPKGLQDLVESYLVEHLRQVRGAREHTVRSYRDALRLFLLFLATKAHCPLSKLTLEAISGGGRARLS